MARDKDVELTLQNGVKVFLDKSYLETAGIANNMESLMGNAVRGTGTPVLKVNASADMTGEISYVIAQNVMSFKITYK